MTRNAFTDLRRSIHQKYSSYEARDIALAERIVDPSLLDQKSFAEMARARRFSHAPEKNDLSDLLTHYSGNLYVRRYVADGLSRMKNRSDCIGIIQSGELSDTAVLELSAEAGIECCSAREIHKSLESGSTSELKRAALVYAAAFPGSATQDVLTDLIRKGTAEGEKLAAWTALAAMDPKAAEELTEMVYGVPDPSDFVDPEGPALSADSGQPLVLQTVFYGDPANPGKAGSGGIGSLVLRLGNALAAEGEETATVACRYLNRTGNPPMSELQTRGHILCRLPLAVPYAAADLFLENRLAITLAFRNMLAITGIQPEIIHVRFLDDASLAVARESGRCSIPVAVTLTPDPHRSLVDEEGALCRIENADDLIILHRIWIGDELTRTSRGLMAIGREAIKNELIDYFPELENVRGRISASVDEGVPEPAGRISIDIPDLLTGKKPTGELNPLHLDRPTILSVGRLAAVKNLPALAEAWSSGLWKTHNLVIVGGDLNAPSDEERHEAAGIRRSLDTAPTDAAGMAVHLPAQPSETVRQLEAWVSRRRMHRYPSLYVASSLKEEFGLAILEAMSTGLISCAPLRGGAGAYIRSGVNSFLIDTRNASTLFRELTVILKSLKDEHERSRSIADSARETVKSRYSIDQMAREYSRFYRGMKREF